jgi:hypothetical protein
LGERLTISISCSNLARTSAGSSIGATTHGSFHENLLGGPSNFFFYYFWKIRKLPSSYRLLNRLVPLTKNHLAKKQWNGSKTYCYCDSEKTNEHLFLSCPCTKNRFVPYLLYLQYFSTHQYQKHFRNSLNGTDKKN